MAQVDKIEQDAAHKAAYFENRTEEEELRDNEWAEKNGLSFRGSGALQKVIAASKARANKKVMVSMRMDPEEIEGFKRMADSEGMPYQTLMKSVLHKYLNGELVRKTAV